MEAQENNKCSTREVRDGPISKSDVVNPAHQVVKHALLVFAYHLFVVLPFKVLGYGFFATFGCFLHVCKNCKTQMKPFTGLSFWGFG